MLLLYQFMALREPDTRGEEELSRVMGVMWSAWKNVVGAGGTGKEGQEVFARLFRKADLRGRGYRWEEDYSGDEQFS